MSLPTSEAEPMTRMAGATEHSWCRAVPGGTGITAVALLLSKPPNSQFLQNALRKLQISHPILNSKLHFDPPSSSFSYRVPPSPHLEILHFDPQSTAEILRSGFTDEERGSIPPLHLILEHELNTNAWGNQNPDPKSDADVFFSSLYDFGEEGKWVLALRLHTSVCDRTSAAALLEDLLGTMVGGAELEMEKLPELCLAIEDCIPSGLGNKPFWARGVDMLGYSLNSFRLANLDFKDTESPRMSRVVRLQMDVGETGRILSSCESKGIKLCALLAAAGLIVSRSSKGIPKDQWEKYAVVTLMDCRSILDPVLSSHHIGFYHSAILNTHDVMGEKNLWDLAKRVHSSFTSAKEKKKHFSDMADLNFLMCKAIENPGLTPSASLRTSLISVFEDSMIDNHSEKLRDAIGLEDFIGCASTHGVGPSIAIFDTIRNGSLDCACVYPYPLHSREQMNEVVGDMKMIILNGIN